MLFQQSEATAAQRRWFFVCVDDTDGKTPETGLTFSAGELQISKNGAAFGNAAGTATELSDGAYYYEATAGELDTLGRVLFKVEKSGVRTAILEVGQVVPWDPYDAVRLGVTALPNANAEAAGGLYTRGSGAGQINQPANGMIDGNVVRWLGTAPATPTTAGVPRVDVKAMEAGVITASSIAADAITAAKVAADVGTEIATAILDAAYEGSRTVRGFFRVARALLINKATGLEGTTVAFRDDADTKDRVSFALTGGSGKNVRTPTIDET